MKVTPACNCFLDFHRTNSKKNTLKNYDLVLSKFCDQFGERDLASITQETVLAFLTEYTEGNKQSTKRLRYSLLSAFLSDFLKCRIFA
jgi:site-specific recombinase XerD